MKIPYGMSNFEELRRGNYLYVDKTRFIELLERDNARYQFLIRPRRFGKTLFVSMLAAYYDINKKDEAERLFKGLYIGEHPTERKNSYLVLRFSFAAIVTSEGNERLIKSFDDCVRAEIEYFISVYGEYLSGDAASVLKGTGAEGIIRNLIKEVQKADKEIFVLIDEYDNFANDLIGTGNTELYYELLQSEGYVRAFYKALKDGTSAAVGRIFITGVSPIMLDDLTSGFNITKNLTVSEAYNEIMGFTEAELSAVVCLVGADKKFPLSKTLSDMRVYYNGYLFNETCEERLYNTDMVLYFLDSIASGGRYPDTVMDDNVKVDYRKIRQMAFNFRDEDLIDRLLTHGEVTAPLASRFTLEEMYKTRSNFVSILYYMGMLTIKNAVENELRFCIPNFVIRTIFWDYFLNNIERETPVQYEELKTAMRAMRKNGDITLFAGFLAGILKKLSNRDLRKFDEKYIKAVMLTLFHLDGVYMIHSEYEVESGYADILLTKDARWEKWITWEWAIEIKYLKEAERERLKTAKTEARAQLARYTVPVPGGRPSSESLKTAALLVIGKGEVEVG